MTRKILCRLSVCVLLFGGCSENSASPDAAVKSDARSHHGRDGGADGLTPGADGPHTGSDGPRADGGQAADLDPGPATRWYGLGSSEFAPWETRVTWESISISKITRSSPFLLPVGEPAVVMDSVQHPVVAWKGIALRRWDGTTWIDYRDSSGSSSFTDGIPDGCNLGPKLGLGPSDAPIVACTQVHSWDGTDWMTLEGSAGAPFDDAYPPANPSMAVDAAGLPTVAWYDFTGNQYVPKFEVFVRQWDGSEWIAPAAESPSAQALAAGSPYNERPLVALDGSSPVVLWASNPDGTYDNTRILLARFNGNAWEGYTDAGGSNSAIDGFPVQGMGDYTLALDAQGRPIIAWVDGDLHVKQWSGSDWTDLVGAQGVALSQSSEPVIVVDDQGAPLMAWRKMTVNPVSTNIYVARWDGNQWREISPGSASGYGVSNSPDTSRAPSMSITSSGHPFVVWREELSTTEHQIRGRLFDGTGWKKLGAADGAGGGVSNTLATSGGPSIAFDSAGRPVVAWGEAVEPHAQIYVRRWDGAQWVEYIDAAGKGSATGRGVSDHDHECGCPMIQLDASDHPIVSWHGYAANTARIARVRRWDGQNWAEYVDSSGSGSAENGVGGATCPKLLLDSQSRPHVLLTGGGSGVRVKYWDGQDWQGSPNAAEGVESSGYAQFALDSADQPVVVWRGGGSITAERPYNVFVRRWDGQAWADYAGASGLGGTGSGGISQTDTWYRYYHPMVVLDQDDHPIVAWDDGAVYIRRWDGADWVEYVDSAAQGSATGDGVVKSSSFRLALDADGDPMLAWSADDEVYLKRWDGADWAEIAGSASGGGISNSVETSGLSAVAVTPANTICVGWSEKGYEPAAHQTLLRCADD